nr:MAG TPA: hypothetical protein [Caudoviricetes sp.]
MRAFFVGFQAYPYVVFFMPGREECGGQIVERPI